MDFYEQKGLLNITGFALGVAHSIHSMTIGKYVLLFESSIIQIQALSITNKYPKVDTIKNLIIFQ